MTQTLTIQPGKVFAWTRGLHLQATEDSTFIFPPELIRSDEQIGTILKTSDDNTLVGFDWSGDQGENRRITVILKPGQSLEVTRSTQTLLIPPSDQSKTFVVLKDKES
jgi:hypothetical protein